MSLDQNKILNIYKESKALLEGHFLLTSGMHSNYYFQCAKVMQYPWYAGMLCKEIADHFQNRQIDVVVAPAMGGIVVGQEIARQLNVRSIFTERVDGAMTLRRGFEIEPEEKVLVAEDVTTTGGSVKEVIELVKESGGNIVGVTALVDRSGGKVNFGYPYFALVQLDVQSYQPGDCPLCEKDLPLVKPGSRNLKK